MQIPVNPATLTAAGSIIVVAFGAGILFKTTKQNQADIDTLYERANQNKTDITSMKKSIDNMEGDIKEIKIYIKNGGKKR